MRIDWMWNWLLKPDNDITDNRECDVDPTVLCEPLPWEDRESLPSSPEFQYRHQLMTHARASYLFQDHGEWVAAHGIKTDVKRISHKSQLERIIHIPEHHAGMLYIKQIMLEADAGVVVTILGEKVSWNLHDGIPEQIYIPPGREVKISYNLPRKYRYCWLGLEFDLMTFDHDYIRYHGLDDACRLLRMEQLATTESLLNGLDSYLLTDKLAKEGCLVCDEPMHMSDGIPAGVHICPKCQTVYRTSGMVKLRIDYRDNGMFGKPVKVKSPGQVTRCIYIGRDHSKESEPRPLQKLPDLTSRVVLYEESEEAQKLLVHR